MIYLGLNANDKSRVINIEAGKYDHVYLFHSDDYKDDLTINHDKVTKTNYSESYWYRTFYPLMQNIDKRSLVIVNEYIKDRHRKHLIYNCLKGFVNQSGGVLVFQYTPFVYDEADILKLLDFDNPDKNRMLSKVEPSIFESIQIKRNTFTLNSIDTQLTQSELNKYEKLKNDLFDKLGHGDPHTIPRQLHLTTGKFKLDAFTGDSSQLLVRNMRLKAGTKYSDVDVNKIYSILDFPISELEFIKFLYYTNQMTVDSLITSAKVDHYFYNSYNELIERINNVNLNYGETWES